MKKIVFCVILIAACDRHSQSQPVQSQPVPTKSDSTRIQIVDASRPTTTLSDAQPAEVQNVVAATYRVRPDRRAVMAVADIYELVTGKNDVVRLSFSDNRWQLACGGRSAGELPEM